MTIEQMRKVRERVNERLLRMMQNKRVPYGEGTLMKINRMNVEMPQSDKIKLKIKMDNVNCSLDKQFNQIPKITLSTTDINYINYLIEKGRLRNAKQVLNNLKSTLNIMNTLITDTENCLLNEKEK